MRIAMSVEVRVNHFPGMSGRLTNSSRQANSDTADEVVLGAKQIAPVKSGALRDEIHKEEGPGSEFRAVSSMPYSADQEYGASRNPAHPYMTPSAEGARSGHRDRMVEVIRSLASG